MLTHTLFDVAAITWLRPTGETYNPSIVREENHFNFSTKRASYINLISNHYKIDTSEFSDQENITFLTFWLSHFVFCTSSLQVAKKFIGMAIQFHEIHNFCLSRLILGSLYESFGYDSQAMQRLKEGQVLSISGPLCVFQMWLVATFEQQLGFFILTLYESEVRSQKVEGTRLAFLIRREFNLSTSQLLSEYFNILLRCTFFTPSMNPFISRTHCPKWF